MSFILYQVVIPFRSSFEPRPQNKETHLLGQVVRRHHVYHLGLILLDASIDGLSACDDALRARCACWDTSGRNGSRREHFEFDSMNPCRQLNETNGGCNYITTRATFTYMEQSNVHSIKRLYSQNCACIRTTNTHFRRLGAHQTHSLRLFSAHQRRPTRYMCANHVA